MSAIFHLRTFTDPTLDKFPVITLARLFAPKQFRSQVSLQSQFKMADEESEESLREES